MAVLVGVHCLHPRVAAAALEIESKNVAPVRLSKKLDDGRLLIERCGLTHPDRVGHSPAAPVATANGQERSLTRQQTPNLLAPGPAAP